MSKSVLQNLSAALARFLAEDEVSGGDAATAAPVSGDRSWRAGTVLENKVAALLRDSGTVLAGRLNFINFDAIRDQAGRRWPDVRDRVFAVTSSIARKYAGPHDLFAPSGDAQFVILFADLKPEEARVLCTLIARKVVERFLGEDGAAALGVTTVVGEVDGHLLLRALDPAGAINDALDGMPPSPPVRPDLTLPSPSTAFGHDYRPYWDTRRGAISTLYCDAWVEVDGRRHGHAVTLPSPPEHLCAEMDRRATAAALADLTRLLGEKKRMLVCVALHCDTLEQAEPRQRIAELLADAPAAMRTMLLIDLVGLPAGVPPGRLSRLVAILKPFCRAILLRRDVNDHDFESLRYSGIASVRTSMANAPREPAEFRRTLENFAAAAHRAGLRPIVSGATDRDMVLAAARAGFDYVNVAVLHPPIERPRGMTRFTLPELQPAA